MREFYWYYSFVIDVEMSGFGKYMRVVVERDCDRLHKTRNALRHFGLGELFELHERAVEMSIGYFERALEILKGNNVGEWESPLPQLLANEVELNRLFREQYHDCLTRVASHIGEHIEEFSIESR